MLCKVQCTSTMYFGGFVARSINSFAIFKRRTLTPPSSPWKIYYLWYIGWGWGLKSSAFLIFQSRLPLECLLNRNFESWKLWAFTQGWFIDQLQEDRVWCVNTGTPHMKVDRYRKPKITSKMAHTNTCILWSCRTCLGLSVRQCPLFIAQKSF